MKDYYSEIDKGIKEYENYRPYHTKSLDWLSDRICWCWKWKKISENQMIELTDRIERLFSLKETCNYSRMDKW